MTFSAIIDQARTLLQRTGKVTYRVLKREFTLDDEALEDVKEQLIEAEGVAVDQDGTMLVWIGHSSKEGTGNERNGETATPLDVSPREPRHPVSYTPSHLAERIRAEQAALEARGATGGERKTITALFADIKGSTDLIADLDPEEARALIDPTLHLMMDAVHRYEGYVAQALGDGIFALFGAPIAHEDHPQRALYAALLMQEEHRKRTEHLRREHGVNLQIRVGVNTGEVVLRSIRKDDLHTDYVPVGHSIHLASRLESLATPGAIVVSEQTYKLTEGYVEFKALGQAQIKGFAEPLPIYEATGVGPLRTKLHLSVRRGLARFVGRQRESEHLQRAWESAQAGYGQMVGVRGEPGIGKSRLFYEFKLLCQRGGLVLETFSVSHGQAYPYLPLIDLLKHYFQLTDQDDERRRREKITGKIVTGDRSLEDTLPYVFFLLGLAELSSPVQQMDGQLRRQRILEAITRLLLRESRNQPLLLIFEDVHWLDAETEAFLQLLSESVATAPILLLVNYRPEYQAPWQGKTSFAQLLLDPLGKEQAEELLAALAGEAATLQPVRQFILDKTEGNPFFMEEIVQELREQGLLAADSGGQPLVSLPSALRLPTTVQGVLTARIDRLAPDEKALLQTLAVMGREFSALLVRNVATHAEEELHRLLARLQAGAFVYEQPAFPEVHYLFKHALTQEVAYHSVLIERRKGLHERTAQAIEEVYRSRLDDQYSELAYHYSRSGNTHKALAYLQLAGQRAVQQLAYAEAIPQLTMAVELLATLPDAAQRTHQELELHLLLGTAYHMTQGPTSPDVGRVYKRAYTLCQHLGDTPQVAPALLGLFRFYTTRAEYPTARQLGEQLLRVAEQSPDAMTRMAGHYAMSCLLWGGEIVSACAHLEQALRWYDPQQHQALTFRMGGDLAVTATSLRSLGLWLLGYPDQALACSLAALTLAQELAHPASQTFAAWYRAYLAICVWDIPTVLEWSERAVAPHRGREHFPDRGVLFRGWALAEQGRSEEGIAAMQEGLAIIQTEGVGITQTSWHGLLARAHAVSGQPELGLAAVSEGLATVEGTGERYWEAELYRLRGELTLQEQSEGHQATGGEAEACLLKAIGIAQQQHAKSWELRATMSLARLWQSQGKKKEAHEMLSEIYTWFTEGFDTKDLQEAKALLEELT